MDRTDAAIAAKSEREQAQLYSLLASGWDEGDYFYMGGRKWRLEALTPGNPNLSIVLQPQE